MILLTNLIIYLGYFLSAIIDNDYIQGNNCLKAGFYSHESRQNSFECLNCPIGYFCKKYITTRFACSENKTTTKIGSKVESDCICKKGYYSIDEEDTCIQCPVNTYKFKIGNSECQSCPSNSQNINKGSESLKSCLCNAGFTFSNRYSTCIPCQNNTYKSEIGNSECHSCRSNSQTINEGSISIDNCLCNAGFTFSNKDSTCIPCQNNTYKSKIGNSECLKCSYGLIYGKKDKLRTRCLKYSIIYGATIAGIIIFIFVGIFSIIFWKKRNKLNKNHYLNRYF